MKNLKYFFISLFMLGAFISASAYDFSSQTQYSVEEGLDSVWLYYSINPDGTTVSVTQGPELYKFNHIRVPETVTHNDTTYTVTEVAYGAFSGGDIDIVEMANTITKIGDYAFNECGIDSIKFSTALKTIGEYAFFKSGLSSVVLPEGLETIGNRAFSHITGGYSTIEYYGEINYVYLPSTLTYIGDYAFFANDLLKSITIPNKITEIRPSTFYGCSSLEEVSFPDGLSTIGNKAFGGCSLIMVDDDFLPQSLTKIGDDAFAGCNFKKLKLPNSVLTVGTTCFGNCSNLQVITFSSGMTELPSYVCSRCANLVEVNIPNSITKIGSYAFIGTTFLSRINLPESIEAIETSCFRSSGLVTISIPPRIEELRNEVFADCKNLSEIKFNKSLKQLNSSVFSGCASLTSIVLPDSLTSIGYGIFANCTSLEVVQFNNGLKVIGQSAFKDCTSLKSIMLPDSLKTIGQSAFYGCVLLKDIKFNEGLLTINPSAFQDCSALEVINLPHSLKTIENSVFRNCTSLTNATIPHAVSTIVSQVFYGCPNLKEVHYKRAILPSGLGTSGLVIEDGNQCTLYVPIGSKVTYEASVNWNNFDTIIEEEIGYDILYRVSASKVGQGSVAINGEAKTSADMLSGSKVGVMFTPASGWKLKSVVLNDKDVTASLVENVYEIETLEANMVFAVTFEELPATLSLRSADGGSIDVAVVKGTTFSCVFTPDENWTINNVRYNNSDVTSSVSEAGEYTTPVIKNDAILSVAYETGDNSVDAISVDADMKAYVLSDGLLVVEGVDHGMPVVVYGVDGKVLSSLVAVDGRCSYQLPDAGVYVVKGVSKSIKVIF